MQTYKVIGVMSGTSLDGVDLAYCHFQHENGKWHFEIKSAKTISYMNEWKEKLSSLHKKDALSYAVTHTEYGRYLGELVKDFSKDFDVDFISSHGHTIFHQPEKGFTAQIGEGAALSAATHFPVICDFRTADVALEGQGAPLVPIGDKLLFGDYAFCLNLGGIANISFDKKGERIAYDICPVNIVLNKLASQKGSMFDKDGEMAKRGEVNQELLNQFNLLSFYSKAYPKSLGREHIDRDYFPLLNSSVISAEDKLCTFCEHIAIQISDAVKETSTADSKMLVTGGGAFNTFLIERIKTHCKVQVTLPQNRIIEFKEALIFAFLGVLRWRGEINCLKSVTGAKRDSSGGAIYTP
jgi:anhydro-N-acetylmuramic acid kinase